MQSPSSTASGAEMLAQHADPSISSTSKTRLHLPYLDGIRALMALYVVHVHLLLSLKVRSAPPRLALSELVMPFFQGHYAVVVFIVLSGYCLMLPVLRDEGNLRGGMATFFKRRARRILPPYYAALLLSALIPTAIHFLVRDARLPSEITSPKSWLYHLLLVHNLAGKHIYEFTAPLWSIATEWQIYFFFPLIFLPVWKRSGETVLLGVAAALGLAMTVLFPRFFLACPWFVFLFALGMVAAKWSLAPSASLRRVPWVAIGVVLALLNYAAVRFVPGLEWNGFWPRPANRLDWFPLPDVVIGIATLCFLMHSTMATLSGQRSALVRALTWRPLVFIGSFSYSVYLIHEVLHYLALRLLGPFQLSTGQTYAAMMVVYVPVMLALAYGFYHAFEKPFLGAPKPKQKTSASSA